MENGNPPKKKSKKKKVRSNSPQASNGSEKVSKLSCIWKIIKKLLILLAKLFLWILQSDGS